MNLQLESIYRQRTTELQILTVDFLIFIFTFVPIFLFLFYFTMDVVKCLFIFYFCQTTSKSVSVNHIQSFSIISLHKVCVICTFEMDIHDLDHQTSHKGKSFEIEIDISES